MSTEGTLAISADAVIGLIEQLQGVEDFESLRTLFVEHFASCGIKMMSYHHLPPIGSTDYDPHITVVAHGFPEEWTARYVSEKLYLVDPIPRHAIDATLPFRWSAAANFDDLSNAERGYLRQLSEAGLGDGLAVPVFGPHARDGYVGLGFGTDEVSVGERETALLRWMAQLGHLAYCDLLRAQPHEQIILSPRECEVLHWAARGKSNAVIAELLSVSRHTVDTHLRRAFSKLSVGDRVTAVLRALSLGLI